jgi:UDP-3-O-[3-hydroxymyristoyl] glucosamine N-acyltransferase
MGITLGELAVRFGCELRGDPQLRIERVAALGSAGPGELSFLANPKLVTQLAQTRATAVVVDERGAAACATAILVSRNPHALFARIATLLHPAPPLQPGVHPLAVIDPRAQLDPSAEIGPLCVIGAEAIIGPRCFIGAGCLIGAGVRVGADSRLSPRVTLLQGVQIAERVLIHAGAVIGADGFGYAREGAQWLKVPQIGGVRIGADVEIGANTTIDRGAIDDTVIEEGVKLDNQIQVGHNVHIGARCMIGGLVGFAGHIEICDDTVITAMSGVSHSIDQPGMYSGLIPAEPVRRWRRIVGRLKLLADRTTPPPSLEADHE